MSAADFDRFFNELTGHDPFPWQRRLFMRLEAGNLPLAVDVPTGLGKTAVMVIWLLARAAGARLPRRLVYVVDRRAVVDQATEFAEEIREKLSGKACDELRRALGIGDRPLPISTLRGRHLDNREWLEDPAAPAIIVGTVDMIGSRLLFEGYGVSRCMRPYQAGLMGCDTLVMLDEAHLARPFERLLRAIEAGRRPSAAGAQGSVLANFTGPKAEAACPPPFRVLPLSATLGIAPDGQAPFTLDDDDRKNNVVSTRLEATKTLTVEDLDTSSKLDVVLADQARDLSAIRIEPDRRPARVLIYCASRATAETVADHLRKWARDAAPEPAVILFVGGRRMHEREHAAEELKRYGLVAGTSVKLEAPVFLVATSAGEVGVDLDADHMVCDLVAWERMVQRLGRVNRRGAVAARVRVIDQGPPEEKKVGKAGVARHLAVRQLLEALPRNASGAAKAGPAALATLGADQGRRQLIAAASTPMPLYPALTRPLVDAWAMTSLAEHTGRPEIGPWLRGWVDDEPQTTVAWRRFLPVRVQQHEGERVAASWSDSRVEAFFEAAPLQTPELLETETWRVEEWLKKRTRKLLDAVSQGESAIDDRQEEEADTATAALDDDTSVEPLRGDTPIAFLLGGNSKPEALTLEALSSLDKKVLHRRLVQRRLVVDVRVAGLREGLLDAGSGTPVVTMDGNWGEPWDAAAEAADGRLPLVRVRTLDDESRSRLTEQRRDESAAALDPWREVLAEPFRASPEGDCTVWLVVEKRRADATDEESRAVASSAQRLDAHQQWAEAEAGRIAEALGLAEADRAMLMTAARHHDDGKAVERWQRAFNARRTGGPYAKTAGPVNQHRLNGFRHEFQSMLDAAAHGLDGLDRSDPRFELALHLIAAHHGHARPGIRTAGCDSLPPTRAARRAHDVGVRFARLQRQWGPWGLAWWEALLRAADQRASRALAEDGRTPAGHAPAPGPATTQTMQPDLFASGGQETG